MLVTGEIPRKQALRRDIPAQSFHTRQMAARPFIPDYRALIIKIKQKGLVVLSRCAHAGIINTILYAQQLANTETIYAVLGGFHLAEKNMKNA